MAECYRVTARYAVRSKATGIPVSVKLIWELVRDHIKHVRHRGDRLHYNAPQWRGYTLNNSLTASIARHIMRHRPEFAGIFELRQEWGAEKREKKTRVIVFKANGGQQ